MDNQPPLMVLDNSTPFRNSRFQFKRVKMVNMVKIYYFGAVLELDYKDEIESRIRNN